MNTPKFFTTLSALMLVLPASPVRAQHAEPVVPFGTDLHPPPSYWQSFLWGGPIYQALHLLLIAAFIGSLVLLFRRTPSSLSLALAFGPFVFGAFATWLAAYGLTVATRSWMYEGNVYSSIAAVPRPFQLGLVLSAAALMLHLLRHAFFRNERSA